MNAVVAIVMLGVTPCGTSVGQGVYSGAPTCSAWAVDGKEIGMDAIEANSKTKTKMDVALVFFFSVCFLSINFYTLFVYISLGCIQVVYKINQLHRSLRNCEFYMQITKIKNSHIEKCAEIKEKKGKMLIKTNLAASILLISIFINSFVAINALINQG